jgi:hypothetical protein
MTIFTDYKELPKKISCHLKDDMIKNYIAGLKTTYKPNENNPILWLLILKTEILFCNTHKTHGLFRKISCLEIDSIKFNKSLLSTSFNLQILFKDFNQDDFTFGLPDNIDIIALKNFLESQNIQIL